jgi:hypothetical protein
VWRYHLFFAIGVILAISNWLTLLPALWWSNSSRNMAARLTLWYVLGQLAALAAGVRRSVDCPATSTKM